MPRPTGKYHRHKLKSGRFKTRFELEMAVWQLWKHTDMNQTQVAMATGVSQGLVSQILNYEGRYIYRRKS
jgi:predicted XRE-type DNA-binding protein